eukprot:12161321-Heterocapsa_arctica.AAC.1
MSSQGGSSRSDSTFGSGGCLMIDVGSPLSIDTSSTQEVRGEVQAYTDRGASHPADPRMRRSGLAIWVKEGHPLNSYGVVPGIEQTAGSAELYAAVK